jgi:hypothetical protein
VAVYISHVFVGKGNDAVLDPGIQVRDVENNKPVFEAVATEQGGKWLQLNITRARAVVVAPKGIGFELGIVIFSLTQQP